MNGNEIKLFLSWKPDRVDAKMLDLAAHNQPEQLRQLSQSLDAQLRIWRSFVVDQSLGEMLSLIGDGVNRACIPADCLKDLEKVRVQAGKMIGSSISVGVGLELAESDRALLVAQKLRGGNRVCMWDQDEMGPELVDAKSKLQKDEQPQPKGAKETPANKGNAGGGFSGAAGPAAPATEAPPRAEGSEHSQGEVAHAEMDARPPMEGSGTAQDFEAQFHGHADAQEEDDNRKAVDQDRYASTRQRVIDLLQQVKTAAPKLEQLQQAAPELYAAYVDLTQALVMTAKAMVEGEKASHGDPEADPDRVQKSEPLVKVWEDPNTAATLAVNQDAVLEGRGQELGARPIPMPPGVSPKRPTARPRAPEQPWVQTPGGGRRAPEPGDPTVQPEGWELTMAATRRTVAAAQNNRWGSEPADSHGIPGPSQANQGQTIHDRDYHGGFQGNWDNPNRVDDARTAESRYWGQTLEAAQNQAFPIPLHDPVTGPDPHRRVWHYHWQYNPGHPAIMNDDGTERDAAESPSWGISSWLRRRDDDNPYDRYNTVGGPQVGAYFPLDPATGLVSPEPPDYIARRGEDTDEYGNTGTREYQQWAERLNTYLASLKGMHKKELSAALEKGKLPLPENVPKHNRVHWPVGWTKGDGKVKVQHPEDGRESWVSVRAGQVLSNDGHTISSRNPDGK